MKFEKKKMNIDIIFLINGFLIVYILERVGGTRKLNWPELFAIRIFLVIHDRLGPLPFPIVGVDGNIIACVILKPRDDGTLATRRLGAHDFFSLQEDLWREQ